MRDEGAAELIGPLRGAKRRIKRFVLFVGHVTLHAYRFRFLTFGDAFMLLYNRSRSAKLRSCALLVALIGSAPRCGQSETSDSAPSGYGGNQDAGTSRPGTPPTVDASRCTPSQVICEGDVAYACDDYFQLHRPVDCAAIGKVCADGLGCVSCKPRTSKCSGDKASYCSEDGSRVVSFACDPLQGMRCTADGCVGSCTPLEMGMTSAGCEFWPTVTANGVWRDWFRFGVAVANAGSAQATVRVTQGESVISEAIVPKDQSRFIELPWVDALKGTDAYATGAVHNTAASVFAAASAYRLRSTQPVTVVQFNPMASRSTDGISRGCHDPWGMGQCLSYSNDASLLLPSHILGKSYTAVGWKAWREADNSIRVGDFLSITATQGGTIVTVIPASQTLAGAEFDAISPGDKHSFPLEQGDVLELFTDASREGAQWSGTRVEANQPVQVLTGSPCGNVPDRIRSCDHLEETALPTPLWGQAYFVTAPRRQVKSESQAQAQVIRVHALHSDTVLTFDPSTAHNAVTLKAGAILEFTSDADFRVSSTKTFAVTHYVAVQGASRSGESRPEESGPSQSVAIPISRYLHEHILSLPDGYDSQSLGIIAPTGSSVLLAGIPIPAASFVAVGATGMSVAHVPVGAKDLLRLNGDVAFGVVAYGFGPMTSYMFPSGLDGRPPSKNQ